MIQDCLHKESRTEFCVFNFFLLFFYQTPLIILLPLLLFLHFHEICGNPCTSFPFHKFMYSAHSFSCLTMKSFAWYFLRLGCILKASKRFAVHEHHSSPAWAVSAHMSMAAAHLTQTSISEALDQTHGTTTNEGLARISGTVVQMQFKFDDINFCKEQDNVCTTDFSLMINWWCERHLNVTFLRCIKEIIFMSWKFSWTTS